MYRCPYCNKDLSGFTDEYIRKHTARCSTRLNPYVYSERKRGRPTNRDKMESLRMMGRV